MGNLNCSNCKSTEEMCNELRSETSSIDNASFHQEQLHSSDFNQAIFNKPNDFKNPYTDYSLALFQCFNLIRTEPLKFYSESEKYNLSNIIEELIDKNDKTLRLTWSTKKEKIINKIMQDDKITDIRKKLNAIKKFFSKDFDIKIYYAKGNFAKIDDALWNALYGLRNLSEEKLRKFLTEKIDYCVIYSIGEDDMKFDNEGENKENEGQNKDNQSNSSGAIISFFILFNNNLHSS